jgi:hypothetical protein
LLSLADDSSQLTGTASQSSIAYGGVPSRALDGNLDQQYSSGSCTHTGGANSQWWRVDFGSTKQIGSVQVEYKSGA